MTDTDTAPDWRDPAAYEYVKRLSHDQRRWELLRRSREYRDTFAKGQLSNSTIARMRFGLDLAPDPRTRGDELDDYFRFASKGEMARIGRSRPAKPLPFPGPTFANFRIDLTCSIGEQVEAIRAEAERLAAALTAEWSAQDESNTAIRLAKRREEEARAIAGHDFGTFAAAQLAGVTRESAPVVAAGQADAWAAAEEGFPELDPRKTKEDRSAAAGKLRDGLPLRLRVLDALDASTELSEIADALFRGHRSNAREAIKDARAAAKAAAKSWP
jgi:hypothetical protein